MTGAGTALARAVPVVTPDAVGAAGVRWPDTDRSVPAEEEVGPPGLVVLVDQVRREHRVHVAARLKRRAGEAEPSLLDRLAALAVIARLAGRDEVLPRVAAATVARNDVVER